MASCDLGSICFIDLVGFGTVHLINVLFCVRRLQKIYSWRKGNVIQPIDPTPLHFVQLFLSFTLFVFNLTTLALGSLWFHSNQSTPLYIASHVWSTISWILSLVTLYFEPKTGFQKHPPHPYFWILQFFPATARLFFLEYLPGSLKISLIVSYCFMTVLACWGFYDVVKRMNLGFNLSLMTDYQYSYEPIGEQKHDTKNIQEGGEPSQLMTNQSTSIKDVEEVKILIDQNEKNKENGDEVSIRSLSEVLFKLLRLARPEYHYLVAGLIFASLSGISSQIANKYYSPIINASIQGEAGKSEITSLCLQLLGIYGFLSVTYGFATFILVAAAEKFVARLRFLVLSAMTKQEMAFFDENKSGELANRLSSDITSLNQSFSSSMITLANSLASVIFGLVLIFSTTWQLSLMTLALVPLMTVLFGFQAVWIQYLEEKSLNLLAKAGNIAIETLSLFRIVRSFGQEKRECERYRQATQEYYLVGRQKGLVEGVFDASLFFLFYGTLVATMWYGSYQIIARKLTPGDLITFFFIALELIFSCLSITSIFPIFGKLGGSAAKVLDILERVPKLENDKGERIESLEGNVEFQDVSFRYPTRPEQRVLENFNLSIRAGEKIAIVGPSGSGKSTIVGLLERFYDCETGKILIDGNPISSLAPIWLHEVIGLVSQEPSLFGTTIRENIRYGNPVASDEDVEQAAKIANAHNFILNLPSGYDTEVGERGFALSGGQKQRIAISRAILKNPKILLLDEATSALDSTNEKEVQEALDKLMIGRTCIIISHRLSTIRNADKIIVLVNGEFIGMGNHDDLLKSNSVYQTMFAQQLGTESRTEL